MTERTVSIYGLIDPRDGSCFYVGRAYTDRLKRRLREHVAETRREMKTYKEPTTIKRKIIWALLQEGLYPEIESLEEIPEEGWGQAERDKMAEYREFCDLCNIAPGGQGPTNWNDIFVQAWEGNPERKKLLSERSKASWSDPDFKEWVSGLISQHHSDPAFREEMSKIQKASWARNPEACQRQAEMKLEHWKDPEYREAVTQSNIEAWKDPELLAEHSERTTEMWKDADYRDRTLAGRNEPGVIEKHAASMREHWAKPGEREAQSERMTEMWADPEHYEKHAAANRAAGPQISESLKQYHEENPGARDRMSEVQTERMKDPARRDHLSEVAKNQWDDPEYREKQLRSRNRGKLRSDVSWAAEQLGVEKVTVYKYCNQGRLGRKVDGSWVIGEEDIERIKHG